MGDGKTAPLPPLANVIDYRQSDMRDSQLRRMAQLEKRVLAYIRRNQLQHDDGRDAYRELDFIKVANIAILAVLKSANRRALELGMAALPSFCSMASMPGRTS